MKWITRSHVHVFRFDAIIEDYALYDTLYAWCRLDVVRSGA